MGGQEIGLAVEKLGAGAEMDLEMLVMLPDAAYCSQEQPG